MPTQTPQTPRRSPPTPAQDKSRRARNVAIGLALAAFFVLIYVVTIVKLGGAVARPPV